MIHGIRLQPTSMVRNLLCFRNNQPCQFDLLDERHNTAFVLMPFATEFDEVYIRGIKDGLPIGWECKRSDEKWDIPDAVCQICKSIQEAVLIIADVTGKNPNVFLELGLSFGFEKKVILVTQNIKDLPFDIRTFNTIEYDLDRLDSLCRKLREAIGQLKPTPRISEEALVFEKNLDISEKILEHQAPHPEQSGPTMQIFIGSKNNEQDWLPHNKENRSLLGCAPSFLSSEVKGRHDYYDFKPLYENGFLRILKNGFMFSRFPCAEWDSEKELRMRTIYIHELVGYIAELFLFACRVMKKMKIRDNQRMKIELLNVDGHPVRFSPSLLGSRWNYDFADYSIVLQKDFNPDNDWKDLLSILVQIYREVCEYATVSEVAEETIKTNLREILGGIRELHTTYSDSGVTALDLNGIFKEL